MGGQVQGAAPGLGQALVSTQAGGWPAQEQPCTEELGATGEWKAGHDLAMCAWILESQVYPGLCQKQCGQQAEEDDSAPLLHSDETPLRCCAQLWGL